MKTHPLLWVTAPLVGLVAALLVASSASATSPPGRLTPMTRPASVHVTDDVQDPCADLAGGDAWYESPDATPGFPAPLGAGISHSRSTGDDAPMNTGNCPDVFDHDAGTVVAGCRDRVTAASTNENWAVSQGLPASRDTWMLRPDHNVSHGSSFGTNTGISDSQGASQTESLGVGGAGTTPDCFSLAAETSASWSRGASSRNPSDDLAWASNAIPGRLATAALVL